MNADTATASVEPLPDAGGHEAGTTPDRAAILEQLLMLETELVQTARGWRPWSGGRPSERDASARNLLQYLTLRRHDLRDTQSGLIELGLSSMAGAEGHVQASLDAVIAALQALAAEHPQQLPASPPPIGFARSRSLLDERARRLLGPVGLGRSTRIMVTLPSQSATDRELVRKLTRAGMDVARINCAHDSPADWLRMAAHVREAERRAGGRPCLFVDIPGPKLRTGALAPRTSTDAKGDYLRLGIGDELLLTRASADSTDRPAGRPRIECSLDEAFAAGKRGDPVWFDDGKLGGVIETVADDRMLLRIVSARPNGSKLRSGKGINLPNSTLDIDVLGAHSQAALHFAAEYADAVDLSFVSRARDVTRVDGFLREHSPREIGLVLKVETRAAFENLPAMLLAALGTGRPVGVMIARGDLALECGYERLAEVQEEILWLCQAAHMPVIWATQVLDQLAKTGRPSRAEITDAAMGGRAECVMLNKGPKILEAIRALDDILRRMQRHSRKQRRLLAPLKAAEYERAARRAET